jgi:hypothetical protein
VSHIGTFVFARGRPWKRYNYVLCGNLTQVLTISVKNICHLLVTLRNRIHIGGMAIIIPFPAGRGKATLRARRIFEAQFEMERTRKQGMAFFGFALITVAALMTTIELISRFA